MSIKFTCTALAGTNKTGILKPDEHGYYKLILGALNFHNAAGIYYDYDTSKQVFEESSSFMRRMRGGNLYSEVEHPEWKPGMSLDDYVRRIRYIDGHNVCAHIREIELVMEEKGAYGKPVCVIYGWVKPDREKGHLLAAALENPKQNVCFSIRSLVEERRVGSTIFRSIQELVGFDWVIEPGISKAHKFNAPGLEMYQSAESALLMADRSTVEIPLPILENVAASYKRSNGVGLGMESDQGSGLDEAIARIKRNATQCARPAVLSQW